MNNYRTTFQILTGLFFVLVAFTSCKDAKNDNKENQVTKELVVSDTLKWSERMILSEIERFPKAS
ncbi:MAG: hypothetical protein AB1Z17_00065, partial [Lutibacter sp.]